jgi:hypothetical protein
MLLDKCDIVVKVAAMALGRTQTRKIALQKRWSIRSTLDHEGRKRTGLL